LMSYALVPASVSKEDGRAGVRLKVEAIAAGKNGWVIFCFLGPMTDDRKRNAVIVTDGRGSLRSSVTAVWGPKALENVLDINLELEVGIDRVMAKREGLDNLWVPVHAVHTIHADGRSRAVTVSGLISSATWGKGRSSADRQFYYMNGRPVDLPVVAKAINEVYKSFNTHQLPLVVLDFTVPRGT
jgi:DNA mismatch repair protein PMS2